MKRLRSSFFFYFLLGYIFIAFVWWMLLLLTISHESYVEKRDLLKLNYQLRGTSDTDFEQSAELREVEKDRRRKTNMIIGEGSFFIVVLLAMTWVMQRILRREAEVANQQKNFLLSVTHELRSPIASSKIALQTLEKHRDLPPEKKETLLVNSLHDIERLQGLVENLLLAAKIEDQKFTLRHEACNLSEMVDEVIQKLKETTAMHQHFELDVEPEVMVTGDRMALTSVVTNLVENAAKYSPAGSNILISLSEEGDEVLLKVADTGPGIPEEEKSKIFRKFYRIGNEETRNTKGTGLGLFIVQKILTLHHGRVSVKDNLPGGTVFEVLLPRGI
jgi:signal transduction histidine kinase